MTGSAMRMSLECGGGFTGPAGAGKCKVDLADLPAADAAHLLHLVQACDFFALPDVLKKPAPQSRDVTNTLRIDDGARSHTVRYQLDAAPPALRKLTTALTAHSAKLNDADGA